MYLKQLLPVKSVFELFCVSLYLISESHAHSIICLESKYLNKDRNISKNEISEVIKHAT